MQGNQHKAHACCQEKSAAADRIQGVFVESGRIPGFFSLGSGVLLSLGSEVKLQPSASGITHS